MDVRMFVCVYALKSPPQSVNLNTVQHRRWYDWIAYKRRCWCWWRRRLSTLSPANMQKMHACGKFRKIRKTTCMLLLYKLVFLIFHVFFFCSLYYFVFTCVATTFNFYASFMSSLCTSVDLIVSHDCLFFFSFFLSALVLGIWDFCHAITPTH